MPETILAKEAKITALDAQINNDAPILLSKLDLRRAIEDPEYMKNISREFIKQHMAEIRAGLKIGDEFVDVILNNKALREQQANG